MTIRFRLFKKSGSQRKETAYSNVYARIRDGRTIDQTVRTEILVQPCNWNFSHECVKAKASCTPEERALIDSSISRLRAHIATSYVADKVEGKVGVSWLRDCIDENVKRELVGMLE